MKAAELFIVVLCLFIVFAIILINVSIAKDLLDNAGMWFILLVAPFSALVCGFIVGRIAREEHYHHK